VNRSIVKLAGVLGLLAVLLLSVVATASADNLLGGKIRSGDVVTVPSTEIVNTDLYAFAREVIVNGTVHGDVVAGAGTVTVNGKVDGDVIVGGGTVNVAGSVGGSVIGGGGTFDVNATVGGAIRAGGGQVTVGGSVARDALVAGGTLNVAGTIGGDLVLAAGQATVTGSIAGSIEGQAQAYTRTGTVGGTEHVTIRPASAWQSPIPTLTYTTDPVFDAIRHFVTVLVFAALALWLVPRGMRAAEETVRRQPLQALGGGVLALALAILGMLVLAIVMVVLAIIFGIATLSGLVLLDLVIGTLLLLALIFAIVIAAAWYSVAVVGLGLARAVMPRLMPSRAASPGAAGEAAAVRPMSRLEEFVLLAVGAAVLVILTSLPIVGPIAEIVVVLLGLGAIGIVLWAAWRRWRSGRGPEGTPITAPPSWGAPAAG
jgi:hypothetical protein